MNKEVRKVERFDQIYNQLVNLALSRFTWSNLPLGLTNEQLETMLIRYGQLCAFKDSTTGIYILPCYAKTRMNVYGLPTEYNVISLNGTLNKTVDIENIVLLKNNPYGKGDMEVIEYYANLISDIDSTQEVNLFQQNIPKIILTEENSKLSAKNIIQKLKEFKLVIFAKKGINNFISQSDILDNTSPYLLDKLQTFRIDKYNEILTILGINNANTEKKERLITDEVNANNDFIQINIDLMYDMREQFCKEFNEKFNMNLKVEKREVDINGEEYIPTEDDNRE